MIIFYNRFDRICCPGILLYIELAISFLVSRKRTVNYRTLRLSRTLKVTGNHVMYDRGAGRISNCVRWQVYLIRILL